MMKAISIILAIGVIILGLVMMVTTFTGPALPAFVKYVFWAMAILNGVFAAVNARKNA